MKKRSFIRFLTWATFAYVLLYLIVDKVQATWGPSPEATSEYLATVTVWVYLLLTAVFLVLADYSRAAWKRVLNRKYEYEMYWLLMLYLLSGVHLTLVDSAAVSATLLAVLPTTAALAVANETTKPERVQEGS